MITTKQGRPRQITDEQWKRIREWKPLKELAKEVGVSERLAWDIRGHKYKQVSP